MRIIGLRQNFDFSGEHCSRSWMPHWCSAIMRSKGIRCRFIFQFFPVLQSWSGLLEFSNHLILTMESRVTQSSGRCYENLCFLIWPLWISLVWNSDMLKTLLILIPAGLTLQEILLGCRGACCAVCCSNHAANGVWRWATRRRGSCTWAHCGPTEKCTCRSKGSGSALPSLSFFPPLLHISFYLLSLFLTICGNPLDVSHAVWVQSKMIPLTLVQLKFFRLPGLLIEDLVVHPGCIFVIVVFKLVNSVCS